MCEGNNVDGCKDGTWFNKHTTGSYTAGAIPYCMKDSFFETGRVIFVGDSDIDFWRTSNTFLSGSYNVGYCGYTCANVLSKIDDMLSVFQPSRVILVCGENDIAAGDDVDEIYNRFNTIIKKINKSDASVIYLGTKQEPVSTELYAKYEAYDSKIKARAMEL